VYENSHVSSMGGRKSKNNLSDIVPNHSKYLLCSVKLFINSEKLTIINVRVRFLEKGDVQSSAILLVDSPFIKF